MHDPRESAVPDTLPQGGQYGAFGGAAGGEGPRKNPLRTLWRHRWLLAVTTVLGLVVAYVVYLNSPQVFEGRARILVSQTGPKLLQQDLPGSLASGAMYLNTQCDLIRSPAILGRVVRNEDAKALPMFRANPELAANMLGYLAGATSAVVGQRSEIITVSVRGPEPNDVAALANLVVRAYQEFNDELKATSASVLARTLDAAKERNDVELRRKYEERLEFQRANAGLSFNRDVRNPVLDRVNALSAALTSAELELVKLRAEHESVKTMLDDPQRISQLLASPVYRSDALSLRRELRDMQGALQSMEGLYLPGSSRVAAQQQRMQRTKEEIEAEEKAAAQAIVADLSRRIGSVDEQVEQYRKWLNEEQAQVLNVNSKQAIFDKLESEIERMEKYSDQLADQRKSIGLAESTGAMNVYPVADAKPNRMPVEPDLSRLLFYGGAAGAALGSLLALLIDFLDQRMRSADDVRHALGLPILGLIPHIRTARTPSARGTIVAGEPMSDVAEAYRTVRTAIHFGVPAGTVRTLLVTSPGPGDGKTTLAANLACALAQAGNRVLLMDCDFRKPAQHRVFELEKRSGLSNVLAGELTLEQASKPVRLPGLSVVPSGPVPANPSEILNSQGFADLLSAAGRAYDIVIVDSPPILPVTDARILSAGCDAVVLALRAEKTTRAAATSARDQVLSVGGRIIGVVVNDVPRSRAVASQYYADEGRYANYQYGAPGGGNGSRRDGVPAAENGSAGASRPVGASA